MKESYGTLSETITGLRQEGYFLDFNIKDDRLVCDRTRTSFSPLDFEIDKVYRFEGASNPDDQSILYAISSLRIGLKGILVNGYGISADETANELMAKLETHSA